MSSDLLTALDSPPPAMDRRSEQPRRVVNERRRRAKQSVGMEISPSGVSLAIVHEARDGGNQLLITDHLPFDENSGPAQGNWSTSELSEALTVLVERHRLTGQSVTVGLGGESCVTRALVGDNEEVDVNLHELTERSHRYLALGRGEKVCCYAEKAINAKRKRAWVTIAHRGFIDTVVAAIAAAGLRTNRMEHSLSAICEVIGSTIPDEQHPILIVSNGCGGADLALSHCGQLLLDYRPTTHSEQGTCGLYSWADAIQKHIKCLRRFLQTQVPKDFDQLTTIYLPGRKTVPELIARQLKEKHSLEVRGFPVSSLSDRFDCVGEPAEFAEMLAAIWYAARGYQSETGITADLLKTVRKTNDVTWTLLAKSLWPVAAALLIVVGFCCRDYIQRQRVAQIESQIESLHGQRIEASRMRAEIDQNQETQSTVGELKLKIPRLSWDHILIRAGRLLPQGTWLESLSIDREENVTIVAASFSDDAIYEYIHRLKSSAQFAHVSLRSTQKFQSKSGPAFRFEVTAGVGDRVAAEHTDTVVDSANSVNERPVLNQVSILGNHG